MIQICSKMSELVKSHGYMAMTLKPKPHYKWKRPEEPRPEKARQVRSNVKVLLTVFFDCNNLMHHEIMSHGHTVNKEYYLEVMRRLRKVIRQKCTEL